ncbi:hypothetical protein L596_012619 [Steinernema carpocapsae]|uniref:Uncharacterized protein n=1 Tax=Steinernema carpocapsae TaxID=34508 RepID=A0A4U5NYJ3_STECR|nr:hypothetical protein L596_012619 [Steinernema carpocapsae]
MSSITFLSLFVTRWVVNLFLVQSVESRNATQESFGVCKPETDFTPLDISYAPTCFPENPDTTREQIKCFIPLCFYCILFQMGAQYMKVMQEAIFDNRNSISDCLEDVPYEQGGKKPMMAEMEFLFRSEGGLLETDEGRKEGLHSAPRRILECELTDFGIQANLCDFSKATESSSPRWLNLWSRRESRWRWSDMTWPRSGRSEKSPTRSRGRKKVRNGRK